MTTLRTCPRRATGGGDCWTVGIGLGGCGRRSHSTNNLGGLNMALARGISVVLILAVAGPLMAASPSSSQSEAVQATASPAARQIAIQSIPFDKLDEDGRTKVNSVLSNITVFRRLPIRVVNCDPDLYLFLIRHPDVVVNIWEVLGITQLQLRQTATDTYRVDENQGTAATLEFLYHNHDTHVIYGEWTYTGPLLARKINGRCLAVLKTGYVRETDGRYYITTRLDGFMSVEPGGAELLTKTLHPLVVKNADANFVQTLAFLGSLSRTAEVNSRGMHRLAGRLSRVQPDTREQLSQVVTGVAERAAALPPRRNTSDSAQLSRRTSPDVER